MSTSTALSTELASNSRVGTVRRWLARPPKQAATLSLATRDDSPQQLGTWEADEVTPELAPEIVTLVDECASARGAEVHARLVFLTAGGRELKVCDLHKRPDGLMETADVEAHGMVLDGSQKSMLVQAQAFASAAIQQLIRGNAVTMSHMARVCEMSTQTAQQLADELRASREERQRSDKRVRELLAALTQAEAEVPAEGEGAEGGGQSELAAMLKPHMPLLTTVLTQVLQKAVLPTPPSAPTT